MLVLTRREGEDVIIDVPAGEARKIVVRVGTIKGDRVRLAIDAPIEVLVNRKEIAEKKGGA